MGDGVRTWQLQLPRPGRMPMWAILALICASRCFPELSHVVQSSAAHFHSFEVKSQSVTGEARLITVQQFCAVKTLQTSSPHVSLTPYRNRLPPPPSPRRTYPQNSVPLFRMRIPI